jgi:hypothetical protein
VVRLLVLHDGGEAFDIGAGASGEVSWHAAHRGRRARRSLGSDEDHVLARHVFEDLGFPQQEELFEVALGPECFDEGLRPRS